MAFLRPRVSRAAEVRYHADGELAARFPELLGNARSAEQALRDARAEALPAPALRGLGLAFDQALTDALRAAEAAQRVTFGARSYDDRIRRRKAKATPGGREWSDEVERLRTLREVHRLTGIASVPRPAAS